MNIYIYIDDATYHALANEYSRYYTCVIQLTIYYYYSDVLFTYVYISSVYIFIMKINMYSNIYIYTCLFYWFILSYSVVSNNINENHHQFTIQIIIYF